MCVVEVGEVLLGLWYSPHSNPSLFPPRISNLLLWIEWSWNLLGRSVRGIAGGNLVAAAADTIRWALKRRGSASLKAQPSNLGHLYSIHVTLPSVNIQKSATSWWHFKNSHCMQRPMKKQKFLMATLQRTLFSPQMSSEGDSVGPGCIYKSAFICYCSIKTPIDFAI